MVDGLHILLRNTTMKPLAMALQEAGGFEGERWWRQSNQCTM
jgi:hypothetical protein